MKRIFTLISIVLAVFATPAHAQIHADFSVSQGNTPLGTFRVRLDYDKAPRTCANFIRLATGSHPWINDATGAVMTNKPFYNGLTFHRLIHNFMIQGGSPNGQGNDSPGFVIQDEYHETLRHSGRYMLSMAKSNFPNTGGSQFFITLEAAPNLDDKHSVFGEVISGKEIIDDFTSSVDFPTDANDRPLTPIVMNSVVISGPGLAGFDLNSPALMLPSIGGVRITPSRDPAAGSFTMSFDRKAQHDYFHTYSFDLTGWTPFRHILSSDDQNQWPFQLTGVTSDRFYSRIAVVNYSLLPNPPTPLMPAGTSFTMSDRSGKTLTLTPNGNGGGTWNDSTGAGGTIVSLTIYDGVGPTGTLTTTASKAHTIPLAQIVTKLDAPSGINNHDSFNLLLSFHSSNEGWIEGTASGGTNPLSTKIQQHFVLTP